MQKVPGVASVRVSLNEGLTVLDLKPSNTVTLAHLREVIRNNGFVTKEAQLTAVGTVVATDNSAAFEVGGSRERVSLQRGTGPQAARYDEARELSKAGRSTTLEISGIADINDPKALKMVVTALNRSTPAIQQAPAPVVPTRTAPED